MAKKEQKAFNPSPGFEEFGSTRFDDAPATVLDGVYAIHKSRNSDRHFLFWDVTLQPEDTDPITIRNFIGFLSSPDGKLKLAPSKDNRTLAGPDNVDVDTIVGLSTGDMEMEEGEEELYTGHYVVGYDTILPFSNLSMIIEKVKKLFPDPKNPDGHTFAPLLDPDPMVSHSAGFLNGYKFHWNQLDQDPRLKRKQKEGETPADFKVLCPTEFIEFVGTEDKPKSKPTTTKSKPAPEPEDEDDADTDNTDDSEDNESEVEASILKVLTGLKKTNSLPVKRQGIQAKVLNSFEDPDTKVAAMDLLKDPKWLGNSDRPWKFSKQTGELSL